MVLDGIQSNNYLIVMKKHGKVSKGNDTVL